MKIKDIAFILAFLSLGSIVWGQVPPAELKSHVDQFWSSRVRSCDGSWYSAHYFGTSKQDEALDGYIEYKNVHWTTTPKPISQADSLNGVQWRGTTTLTAVACRWAASKGAEWQPWANGTGTQDPSVDATKINGVWTIAPGPSRFIQGVAALRAPSCEEVREHLRLQAGMVAPRQQARNRQQLGSAL